MAVRRVRRRLPSRILLYYYTIIRRFTIAAAFGNVHGVYKAGNVKLQPELLGQFQAHAAKELGQTEGSAPLFFVFHGGSGSEKSDIEAALVNGVVKMNARGRVGRAVKANLVARLAEEGRGG